MKLLMPRMRDQRTVAAWDLPTRLFKWSLVACVLTAFLVSSQHPRGVLFLVHVSCGYAVTLLLLFRFTWGLIGSETPASAPSSAAGHPSARTPRACSASIPREPPDTTLWAAG